MVAGSNKELDDLTRPHNMIAKPGPIMKRKAECMKYFHDVEIIPGVHKHIWTPEPLAALQTAIDAAGFREGEAIPRAKVQEVAALFLESPSATGCNMLGCAEVIPALFLFPVPFPTSFGSLSCNPTPFAFSPFCSCAAVERKLKTLGLWQRTKSPSFSWTPVASEALQVAIDAAGANVQEVVALFLQSPSAEGCNKEGDAGVLPALIFILVPLPPSLALSCESH